jgi:hypothetical protein
MLSNREIATLWIDRFHRVRSGSLDLTSRQPDVTDAASNELLVLCISNDGYMRALDIILCIKELDSSEVIMDSLSAGPLESILMWHADEAIEEVERLCLCDDKFKNLLRGVWNNGFAEHIWRRIEKASE